MLVLVHGVITKLKNIDDQHETSQIFIVRAILGHKCNIFNRFKFLPRSQTSRRAPFYCIYNLNYNIVHDQGDEMIICNPGNGLSQG